jgi:hypothetical protein
MNLKCDCGDMYCENDNYDWNKFTSICMRASGSVCFVFLEVKSAKIVTKVVTGRGLHHYQTKSREWEGAGHSCHACNLGTLSVCSANQGRKH